MSKKFFCSLLVCSVASELYAASEVFKQIRIVGNKRVEPETVFSYLKIRPHQAFDKSIYDQSLKTLYATGLFSDVSFVQEGDTLVIQVVENPIINRIAFEGNDKVSDDILKAEVGIRSRDVYNRSKIQSSVKRILDIYRLKGRFSAKVEPKIIKLPENRVDLVFEITEGPITAISQISFVGNKKFSAYKLKDIILTKESRWYRFFSANDTYDPDRLSADREILRRFYLKNGYADFRIISAVAELSPSAEEFFITFTLDEGDRYKFGKVSFENRIPKVDIKKFQKILTINKGDWYNEEEIEKSIRLLTDELGNQGYAFIDIRRHAKRNRAEKTIDLTLEIVESSKIFVDRIDIEGNVHTRDHVIRRELRLAEGDAYNSSKERESRHRVRELGFFKTVDIAHERSDDPSKTIMKVQVAEKATGDLSFGLGFSTMEGPFTSVRYNQANLMGRGQDLRSEFQLARYNKAFDISFTEPYFMDKSLSSTIGLFRNHQSRGYARLGMFEQTTQGGMVGFGYHISGALSQQVRYSLHRDEISDVNERASSFIKQQTGSRLTSSIGQTLIYDKRDSRIETTSGYYVSLSNDFAGLGGDIRYVRNRVEAGIYYPIQEQWILSLKGRGGIIFDMGRPTRTPDRFSLGGPSLRGFEYSGVGPRDINTRDPLNGLKFYSGSLQLTFPLGLPNEFGIKAHAFSDVGSLWGNNTPGNQSLIADTRAARISAGGGLSWNSPMGTISIDIGQPIRKQPYDKTRVFLLNLGTSGI